MKWFLWIDFRAYDRAAIKFRGVDADINFNVSDYDEDIKQVCEHLLLCWMLILFKTWMRVVIVAWTLILLLCRWVTLLRKSLCIFCVDRALVSRGEAPSTGELLCTNVDDGKLAWDSFLGRSEKTL